MTTNRIIIEPNATYSRKEVMQILDIGRDAMRRRVLGGEIKYSLMGNKYRFLGQDILNYLKSLQK